MVTLDTSSAVVDSRQRAKKEKAASGSEVLSHKAGWQVACLSGGKTRDNNQPHPPFPIPTPHPPHSLGFETRKTHEWHGLLLLLLFLPQARSERCPLFFSFLFCSVQNQTPGRLSGASAQTARQTQL
jgi:hypothetical protein